MLPRWTSAAAAAAAVAALATTLTVVGGAPPGCRGGPTLTCHLRPTSGHTVRGVVTLSPSPYGCGALLTAHITGLAPASVHGWHIHEAGDVSAADGSATGGHYNPRGGPHGLPGSAAPLHGGDLGNLPPADGRGVAVVRSSAAPHVVPARVVGRGLIVHAARDDGGQPTGNAGARLAQCVLGVAAEAEAPAAPPPYGEETYWRGGGGAGGGPRGCLPRGATGATRLVARRAV
ncbi:hypothetical protein BU14_0419s0002 [Porphyra umbilicalis]|uniref:Superoxide dismutase copper/zinc binding domain-containing protein n=1 Tax=Porphyra umbilicalis TaxID=2786 RepID=A0A1X6NVR2_PORUM|nr:hypothetical protein BU14_0419s0002 [Porphyra umbilicalis]|eukprot:OSX72596.1 hypothetical protein BU14_0419s0002 [Porphyra umbilicalis]